MATDFFSFETFILQLQDKFWSELLSLLQGISDSLRENALKKKNETKNTKTIF